MGNHPRAEVRSRPVYGEALAGVDDARVFERAVKDKRVIVTESFADYALLLERRLADGEPCVPVVFVRKARMSRGAGMPRELARRLHAWALDNPDPYLGPHWA